MNLTSFHGMKQNEYHSSGLSVVKNSWKSDKQLHCWNCFRAKSSSNSCLFWPLTCPFFFYFFLKLGEIWFSLKRAYRLVISEVRKNFCPYTIVIFWLLWRLNWRLFLLLFSLFTLKAQSPDYSSEKKRQNWNCLILRKEFCNIYLAERLLPRGVFSIP